MVTHSYKYIRVLAHTCTHALLPDLQPPLMLTHAHTPCPTRRVRVDVQAAAPGRLAYEVAEEHAAGSRPGDLRLHRKEAGPEPGSQIPVRSQLPGFLSASTTGLGATCCAGSCPACCRASGAVSPDPRPHPQRCGDMASPPRPGLARLITSFSVMISGAQPGGRKSTFLGKAQVENNYQAFLKQPQP